jgi:hypothetical protein
MTEKGSTANNGRKMIYLAKVPPEAGLTRAIQVYRDGVNDGRVVLQCENGNWLFDTSTNTIVPLLGKNSNVIVRNGKIIRI